ncbi:hypothetical protein HYH03_005902 [Edaphochlamys debaryana]|uniref:Serine aminopeptidase S33 domain-containing protein n=1 Tax=Edaphochlamys debaryana TaxID=47281 RepID=A0A836C1U4_9CHLO|nr:hypothetical protein HYH03_005902 [Edaphochlamys debaryana]|eukprot:KAG2495973.1 hypothetical protein HYH03_005902 [Edaphochlamys debaryana]
MGLAWPALPDVGKQLAPVGEALGSAATRVRGLQLPALPPLSTLQVPAMPTLESLAAMLPIRLTAEEAAILGIAGGALVLACSVLSSRAEARRMAAHRAEMDARRSKYVDDSGAGTTAAIPNAQGLKLFLRHWTPEAGQPAAGVVVMVHGFAMHGGTFARVARQLATQGLATVASDLQGNGLSDGAAGLRGYVRRFDDYVDDLDRVMASASERHPGVPLFLLGESLGGTVVLQALRRRGVADKVRGAVLMAPAIRVSPRLMPPPVILPLLIGLSLLFPTLSLPGGGTIPREHWVGAFGDTAWAEAAYGDPLITLQTPRLNMMQILLVLRDLYGNLEQIRTPLLVCHSPDDVRTQADYSQHLVQRAAGEDKEMLLVPGGRHSLFLDTPEISSRVTAHVIKWLASRC